MKTNWKKTGMYCMGSVLGSLPFLAMMMPTQALAVGWDVNDMIGSADLGDNNKLDTTQIDQNTIFKWVQDITTWAFGIAVVLFALKVALTAIHRMLFANNGGGGGGGNAGRGSSGGGRSGGGDGFLTSIPIIGAYDDNMAWKEIWIAFGKNVAIVAGVWILIQLLVSAVMFVFGTLTTYK